MTPTPHQPDSGIDIEALRIQVKMALDDPRTPYAAARFADACRALLDRLERAEGLVKMQREALDLVAEGQALRKKFDFAEAAAGAVPEGFALVPIHATNAITCAIERQIDSQLTASGMDANAMFRQDGDYVWDAAIAAALAAPPAQGLPAAPELEDLAMLTRKLVHSLKKAQPDSQLAARALDYLKRKGLQGSPLRAATTPPAAAPSEPVADARIDLLIQVDNLCSQIEESLYAFRDDAEARRKAQGAIDHAKKVAAPYRWNGATPPAQDAGTGDAYAGELDEIMMRSKLRLLQGASTMVCNMLERDGKPVRADAAAMLREAVGEVVEQAQASRCRAQGGIQDKKEDPNGT